MGPSPRKMLWFPRLGVYLLAEERAVFKEP